MTPTREPFPLEIVRRIVDRWHGDRSSVRILACEKNFVYEFRGEDADLILRLSWQSERTAQDFLAELEFMTYLGTHGANVSLPVPSRAGNWVEVLEVGAGRALHAVVFIKLPGERPRFDPDAPWDGGLLAKIGRTLGRLHALSAAYGKTAPARRFALADLDLPARLAPLLGATEPVFLERLEAFWSWMGTLPRDPGGGYGLVHGDFHGPNLLLAEGEVFVLDFDNCCYCWYAFDIAQFFSMALLPLAGQEPAAQEERARFLFRHFLRGYLRENVLARRWIEDLGEFMRGFDLLLYFGLMTKMQEVGVTLPLYDAVRAEMLAGKPRVTLDFGRLYDELRAEAGGGAAAPERRPGWLGRLLRFFSGR